VLAVRQSTNPREDTSRDSTTVRNCLQIRRHNQNPELCFIDWCARFEFSLDSQCVGWTWKEASKTYCGITSSDRKWSRSRPSKRIRRTLERQTTRWHHQSPPGNGWWVFFGYHKSLA
jgi:hypothetical protein